MTSDTSLKLIQLAMVRALAKQLHKYVHRRRELGLKFPVDIFSLWEKCLLFKVGLIFLDSSMDIKWTLNYIKKDRLTIMMVLCGATSIHF